MSTWIRLTMVTKKKKKTPCACVLILRAHERCFIGERVNFVIKLSKLCKSVSTKYFLFFKTGFQFIVLAVREIHLPLPPKH